MPYCIYEGIGEEENWVEVGCTSWHRPTLVDSVVMWPNVEEGDYVALARFMRRPLAAPRADWKPIPAKIRRTFSNVLKLLDLASMRLFHYMFFFFISGTYAEAKLRLPDAERSGDVTTTEQEEEDSLRNRPSRPKQTPAKLLDAAGSSEKKKSHSKTSKKEGKASKDGGEPIDDSPSPPPLDFVESQGEPFCILKTM